MVGQQLCMGNIFGSLWFSFFASRSCYLAHQLLFIQSIRVAQQIFSYDISWSPAGHWSQATEGPDKVTICNRPSEKTSMPTDHWFARWRSIQPTTSTTYFWELLAWEPSLLPVQGQSMINWASHRLDSIEGEISSWSWTHVWAVLFALAICMQKNNSAS